ncbi:MAG: septation protein A [Bauldia sp.]
MVQFEAAPNEPHAAGAKQPNPLLKLALELGPLGVFFFANARGAWLVEKFPALGSIAGSDPENAGLFVATAAFIVATLVALAVSLAVIRRIPVMPLVSCVVVVIFGGLTLWLQDATFIKMKPTIINGLFAAVLLGGLAFGKSLIGYVFDSVFQLTDEGWRKLTLRWGLFFVVLAVLNEIVWRSFPTDTWVSFKVFGVFPLTLLFTFSQVPLILRETIRPAGETPPA